MSEAVSALGNVSDTDGIADIHETGPTGMITLRGDLATAKLVKAVKAATKADMPGPGRAEVAGDVALCWMSPDELLVLCPYGAVAKTLQKVQEGLSGTHALAVDVSEARAVFRVTGPQAREVVAKLAPMNVAPDAFPAGSFRRSRLAQIPAAFRALEDGGFEIICFRSVAQYAFDLLRTAAQPGSTVGYF